MGPAAIEEQDDTEVGKLLALADAQAEYHGVMGAASKFFWGPWGALVDTPCNLGD